MQITMNDLTVNMGQLDPRVLVEDWEWLLGPNLVPILVTSAGDAFLQDALDGSVWFLDTQAGEASPVAQSVDEFRALLVDQQFVQEYLSVEMVAAMISGGCLVGPGQVYDLQKPLVLGGEFAFENVSPRDMEVHFSVLGQIHQQVSKLPPGTDIGSLSIG